MALPIRDGNQSPTTLSTIIISNAHVPAHTVVSLGTQAITDIATAVSGVELGPNTINALENITVTLGQVTVTGGLTDAQLRASAVTIGGSVTATISGTASVTFSEASVTFSTAVVTGSTSILNFPATQTVTFTQASVTFGQAIVSASNITGLNNSVGTDGNTPTSTNFIKIGGHQDGSNQIEHIVHVSAGGAMKVDASDSTVTFGTAVVTGSTSILNFPAIQTVTFSQAPVTFGLISGTVTVNSSANFDVRVTQGGDPVDDDNPFPIDGTVTANLGLNELPYIKANINITETGLGTLVTNVFMRRIGQYKYQSISGWAGGEDEAYVEIELKQFGNDQFLWKASSFGGVSVINTGEFAFANPQNAGGDNGNPFPPTTFSPLAGFTGTMTVSYEQPSTQPISGTVTVGNSVTVAGTVTIGNSVTISTLLASPSYEQINAGINSYVGDFGTFPISGTVTANGGDFASPPLGAYPSKALRIGYADDEEYNAVGLASGGKPLPVILYSNLQDPLGGTTNGMQPLVISGTVTIGAGTAQIGSVTVGNTVTIANIQGTSVTTSNFTSTTPSTVLAGFNATREVLTIFNEGAGNLHICAGETCTTLAYQVRLSAGDYYEVPLNQTSLTHSAVFATAGTARIVQIS